MKSFEILSISLVLFLTTTTVAQPLCNRNDINSVKNPVMSFSKLATYTSERVEISNSSRMEERSYETKCQIGCEASYPIEWKWTRVVGNNFNWNVTYIRTAEMFEEDAESDHNHNGTTHESQMTIDNCTTNLINIIGPRCQQVGDPCTTVRLMVTENAGKWETRYIDGNITNDIDQENVTCASSSGRQPLTNSECQLDLVYDKKSQQFICVSANQTNQPSIHVEACNNPTECDTFVQKLELPKCNLMQALSNYRNSCGSPGSHCVSSSPSLTSGIVVCSTLNGTVQKAIPYFTAVQNSQKRYTQWDEPSASDMLVLSYDSGLFGTVGRSYNLTCKGSYYYFASGFHVTVKGKSGQVVSELNLVEIENPSQSEYLEYEDGKNNSFTSESNSKRLLTRSISRRVFATSGLFLVPGEYELKCYAPVWNSTQWITDVLTIKVEGERAPYFLDGKHETLVDFGPLKNITCVAKGNPIPRVTWKMQKIVLGNQVMIDNGDFGQVTGSDNVYGWAILTLPPVLEPLYENFICHAENSMGYIEKTYHIQRTDPSAMVLTKIASGVVVIGFSINLVVIYLLWKYIFTSKSDTQKNCLSRLLHSKQNQRERVTNAPTTTTIQ